LKPKAIAALVVIVFLLGIVTIIQSNLAYAASSEKILLIQKFEQFPGQEITGFCYLQIDDEGNLDWRIKVRGLAPGTQGHFDLGHWAGEVDVPFTAGDDGDVDSKNQIIISKGFTQSLLSQFAKCQVHTLGYNHFTSPVIALGIPGSINEDSGVVKNLISSEEDLSKKNLSNSAIEMPNFIGEDEENTKLIPTEKKFFLFATLEYVFGIFTNKNIDTNENKNQTPLEKNALHLSETEINDNSNAFLGVNSVFGPPTPSSKNLPSNSSSDKGSSDKGSSDKGHANNSDDLKKCNTGQQKKGLC